MLPLSRRDPCPAADIIVSLVLLALLTGGCSVDDSAGEPTRRKSSPLSSSPTRNLLCVTSSSNTPRRLDIDVGLETRVTGLSAEDKVLKCGDETVDYDKLLPATGGQPRRLDAPGADLEGIYLLRTRRVCDAIIEKLEQASRAVLVGSSFIGMETATALRTRGLDVGVVSLESEPFERAFGSKVGETFRDLHEEHDVQFHLDSGVDCFEGDHSLEAVVLEDGTPLEADLAIVGVGMEPATSFLSSNDLENDGSLDVDAHLKAAPDIYAAGDIARFPDPRTYRKIRIRTLATRPAARRHRRQKHAG